MNNPNVVAQPITGADLAEYLKSKDDFALERQVYHIANGLGLRAQHAGLYEDPATSKPRQFDIRCYQEHGAERIELAIECKSLSPMYPLVASCVPRTPEEAYHEMLYQDSIATNVNRWASVKHVRDGKPYPLYRAGEGVCKSLVQVGRDRKGELAAKEKDDVFDKWMQALASIGELVVRGVHILSRTAGLERIAFLPVLVVPDGTLWVADYSSRGDLKREPFPVDEIEFYLGRQYHVDRDRGRLTFTVTHLHVVTRTQIGSILQVIAQHGGIWQQLFPT